MKFCVEAGQYQKLMLPVQSGKPVVLAGEDSVHAKSLYSFARKVADRVEEIKAAAPASVIQIQ